MCRDMLENVRYRGYSKGTQTKSISNKGENKALINGISSTECSLFSGSRNIQFVLATLRTYFSCLLALLKDWMLPGCKLPWQHFCPPASCADPEPTGNQLK